MEELPKKDEAFIMGIRSGVDQLLSGKRMFRAFTSLTHEQFDDLLEGFVAYTKSCKRPPEFLADGDPHVKNGDNLERRHVLMMALINKRLGLDQVLLASFFSVNPKRVNMYVRFADSWLLRGLPDVPTMTGMPESGVDPEIFGLQPDSTLVMNTVTIEVIRPEDRKALPYNASFCQKIHDGRIGDGRVLIPIMDLPKEPRRRKKKGMGKKSKSPKMIIDDNSSIFKPFLLLAGPYVGTKKDLDTCMGVVMNLINYRLQWEEYKRGEGSHPLDP